MHVAGGKLFLGAARESEALPALGGVVGVVRDGEPGGEPGGQDVLGTKHGFRHNTEEICNTEYIDKEKSKN